MENVKSNQHSAQSTTTSSLPRLLIVDDEKDILQVCKSSLSGSFQVTTFSDPAEALDYFRTHSSQFEMILTDIRMPKLNGFQLAKRIRELNATVPILFMTAFNIYPTEFQTDYPTAKKDDFIQKPNGLMQLKVTLFQCLPPPAGKGKDRNV